MVFEHLEMVHFLGQSEITYEDLYISVGIMSCFLIYMLSTFKSKPTGKKMTDFSFFQFSIDTNTNRNYSLFVKDTWAKQDDVSN